MHEAYSLYYWTVILNVNPIQGAFHPGVIIRKFLFTWKLYDDMYF